MVREADSKGDGTIRYDDFVAMTMTAEGSTTPVQAAQLPPTSAQLRTAPRAPTSHAPPAPSNRSRFPTTTLAWQSSTAKEDALGAIVLLQSFDGAWQLNDELACAVNCPLSHLALPPEHRTPLVWATAIALAFLTIALVGRREEWALLADKARAYIQRAGGDAERLIEAATRRLKSYRSVAAGA